MTDNKTGRPAIGTPVTVTLPDLVLEEAAVFAKQDGVSRSEVIRLAVIAGMASRRAASSPVPDHDAETQRLHEELRPAAGLITSWIAADPEEVRRRFLQYRRVASSEDAKKLVQFLVDATRELLENDALGEEEALRGELIVKLSNRSDWRLRSQLFFETLAELGRRGVRMPPARPGDPDEGGEDREPGEALDEDYA